MKRIILLIIFILPLSGGFAAFAAEKNGVSVPLTVEKAVELAVKNSEDMEISKKSIEKTKNRYREVHSLTYPQVSGQIGWQKYIKVPSYMESYPGEDKWKLGSQATITQLVWAFGKVSTAVEIAEKYMNIENLAYDLTKKEIESAAKKMYFTVIFAQEALKIAEESYENVLMNQKSLSARFSSGRVSRVDNVKMAADVAGRRPAVLKAKKGLELVLIDFKKLLNLDNASEITCEDYFNNDFKEISYDKYEKMLLENEPALKVMRESIKLTEKVTILKKRENLPELGAFASYDYGGVSDDALPKKSIMESTAIAGLNMRFNIWDSGKASGAYAQSLNDFSIAELEYSKRLKEMKAKLRSLIYDYSASVEEYKANIEAQSLASESYTIALTSFESGAASLIQVNDAELFLTSTKLQTQESIYNIKMIIVDIEKLTGINIFEVKTE